MAVHADREHFIPLRYTELIDFLLEDRGPRNDTPLTSEQSPQIRRLGFAIQHYFHHHYHRELLALKEAYTGFDPDKDTINLKSLAEDKRPGAQAQVFSLLDQFLQKANYRRLERAEIQTLMDGASYWGLDMDVDWNCFEKIEIYCRGDNIEPRQKRVGWKFWKKEFQTFKVKVFKRLVLLVKQQPHKRLGKEPDIRNIFIKLFKDIPQVDLEMIIPGTKIKMPKLARGKLGFSILSTVGYIGYKLASSATAIATAAATAVSAFTLGSIIALYGPIALVFGYGYKTWSGFQVTKQTYSLQLTQSLYYQNLDNNGGVLYRLLDEAEEQESREALMGYFYLWRHAGSDGWTAEALDEYIELDLERRTKVEIDFEIADAINKLVDLKLVEKVGERYRAIPLNDALTKFQDINTYLTRAQA
jgi:hypothetical protein